GPRLAAEVPHAGVDRLGVLAVHRQHRAAGREVGALEHSRPRLAAVGRLVDAAVVAVAPQLARHADVDGVGAARVDEDLGDALRVRQAHVGPTVAAVGRLVDAVADRDAVARPRLAAAHPHGLRVLGVDGDGADRLHAGLVEHRLVGGAAVERPSDAAAAGA